MRPRPFTIPPAVAAAVAEIKAARTASCMSIYDVHSRRRRGAGAATRCGIGSGLLNDLASDGTTRAYFHLLCSSTRTHPINGGWRVGTRHRNGGRTHQTAWCSLLSSSKYTHTQTSYFSNLYVGKKKVNNKNSSLVNKNLM